MTPNPPCPEHRHWLAPGVYRDLVRNVVFLGAPYEGQHHALSTAGQPVPHAVDAGVRPRRYGGTFFSGPNRKQDPYLEVTIIAVVGQAFEQCRDLLVQPSFEQNSVRIAGTGKFTSRPGIGAKKLGIVRMDSLSDCKLVPRR